MKNIFRAAAAFGCLIGATACTSESGDKATETETVESTAVQPVSFEVSGLT